MVIGFTLVGALSAQAIVTALVSLQRAYFENRAAQLSRERIQLLIEAAKLQVRGAEQQADSWNGYRKFEVTKKALECEDVWSFYLTPHDRRKIPGFKPGQYLTFQLRIPGRDKAEVRCYSLSDSPYRNECYRVTIKKALPPPDKPDAPPGIASSFFCDHVKEGDILDVKAPGGHFFLDLGKTTPVVLIGGGVGMTPVLSMLNALLDINSQREIWFFFGARNRSEHIQKEYLEKVAAEHENVHLQVCYSRPDPGDKLGSDYHHASRVNIKLLKEVLPSSNFEYYICGPGPMMNDITEGLKAWGVPKESVFFESFGPATVKKVAPPPKPAEVGAPAIEVTFANSKKTCKWQPEAGTLLDLAERNGVQIKCGCRSGSCRECLVAIRSGSVENVSEADADPESGSCLTCISRPKSNLVLDA